MWATSPRGWMMTQPEGCARRMKRALHRRFLTVGEVAIHRVRRSNMSICVSSWSRAALGATGACPRCATARAGVASCFVAVASGRFVPELLHPHGPHFEDPSARMWSPCDQGGTQPHARAREASREDARVERSPVEGAELRLVPTSHDPRFCGAACAPPILRLSTASVRQAPRARDAAPGRG